MVAAEAFLSRPGWPYAFIACGHVLFQRLNWYPTRVVAPTPYRPKQRSSDDLDAVKAIEDREAQLRVARTLLEEAHTEAQEARAQLQLEREKAKALELQRQLDAALATAKSPVRAEKPSSAPPNALVLHGAGRKVVIPLALITAGLPMAWAAVDNVLAIKQQLRSMNEYIANSGQRSANYESRISALERDNSVLRETVAKQAGYLEGVLPKAGVRALAERGAEPIDVVSDPLPPGTRPKHLVNVTTPIPAPPPRK